MLRSNQAAKPILAAADQDGGLYTEELYSELLLAQLALERLSAYAATIGQTKPIACPSRSAEVDLRQQGTGPTICQEDTSSGCALAPEPESVGMSGRRGAMELSDPEALSSLTEERVPKGSITPAKVDNTANGCDSAVMNNTTGSGMTTSKTRTTLSRGRSMRLGCTCCFETFPKRKCMAAPCSHIYCRECITSLVEACIRDESLYPIKCCKQPLSKAELDRALNAKLRAAFELKCREFNTSPDLRVYCSNQKCSIFICSSANRIDDVLCSACRTSTCMGCKQGSHPNDTCQGNAETLKVHELAASLGWQTCPGCKAIVQLVEGCCHITCRCSTEFCYVCGDKWKKCQCARRANLQVIVEDPCGGGREPRGLRAILTRWIRRLRC